MFLAANEEAESPYAVGEKIFSAVEVSFGPTPNIVQTDSITFFAGARSDAFFFDFDGIKNLFDTTGGRNFTAPHLGGTTPWTGVDSNTEANVFSIAIELPTAHSAPTPTSGSGAAAACSATTNCCTSTGPATPSVSSFFNTDETKEEYNASEPVHDRQRWIGQFIHLMGHTGDYTREEAIEAIDAEGTLPDMLTFNPSKPAKYPNGRVFTDDVIDYRLAFLTKGDCPPTGLSPHTDTLDVFPYLGPPTRPANRRGSTTAWPRRAPHGKIVEAALGGDGGLGGSQFARARR